MNSIERFKELWSPDMFNKWETFDINEVENAPINELTKQFLKVGFPDSAAPFLDFGWKIYKGRCLNIFDCYPKLNLNEKAKNYWIFGSDNNGNPICFDVSRDDKLVLLDHEQRFEIIEVVNNNIAELAACLLLFRNFIERIQNENGEDAFLESNISKHQIEDLKNDFKQLNINIFKESGFWRSEINALDG